MPAAEPAKCQVKLLVRYLPNGTLAVLSTVVGCAINVAISIDGQRASGKKNLVVANPEGGPVPVRRPHQNVTQCVAVRHGPISSVKGFVALPSGPVHIPRCVRTQAGIRPKTTVAVFINQVDVFKHAECPASVGW